jgi:predicted transposase YdaD
MSYFDIALPFRMLRYRADIWEYFGNLPEFDYSQIKSIVQVVIFFDESSDNELNHLEDSINSIESLKYEYKVVRIWELEAEDVIREKLERLYPLLPLMRHKEGATDEEIIVEAVDCIKEIADESIRNDMFAAMSFLSSGRRFSRTFLYSFIGMEVLMESELFQELTEVLKVKTREEGRAEGRAEGKAETEVEFSKVVPLLIDKKTIHEIAKDTGIPLARVKAIKVLMKNALKP